MPYSFPRVYSSPVFQDQADDLLTRSEAGHELSEPATALYYSGGTSRFLSVRISFGGEKRLNNSDCS